MFSLTEAGKRNYFILKAEIDGRDWLLWEMRTGTREMAEDIARSMEGKEMTTLMRGDLQKHQMTNFRVVEIEVDIRELP